MATIALVLVLGGVMLLSAKELLETRVKTRVKEVREKIPDLNEFKSNPKGPRDLVKALNDGNLGAETSRPRLEGTLTNGVTNMPALQLKDLLSGRDFGQVYFTVPSLR
jgi:hypothetical protein